MHARHGLFLLASTAALIACPDSGSPDGTTENAGTSSSGEPGTTAAPGTTDVAPTDTGSTEPTGTEATDTGPGETGSTAAATTEAGMTGTTEVGSSEGTSGTESTGTGSTGTDTTDTGTPACEPSWTVPDVSDAELAAHDFAWIGCELTACGAEDLPGPGEPSVLCQEFAISGAPLEYLGKMHINDTGAFTTDNVVSGNNFSWLHGMRHVYRYGEVVYIMTEGDLAADQLAVWAAVRALEILRVEHPDVHGQLMAETLEFPDGPPLDGYSWKNRLRSFIFSFDTSPQYIAAGLTVLDADPVANMMSNLDEYSNVAAISIDSETIRGTSDTIGSKPIYGEDSADENYLRYLREGLVETMVHEMVHLRVDRLNSVDVDMNYLWDRRGDPQACASWELEEALVAASSLVHFRKAGGISDVYLDYYDVVLDQNLEIIMDCPDYATWAQQFSIPSGVDARYDLRIVDLP